MFESSVDGFGRAVRGSRSVEEREDVGSSLFQGPAETVQLRQELRDVVTDRVDHRFHHGLAGLSIVGPVGGDDALVDAPGRLNLHVRVAVEQRVQSVLLLVGEEVATGVQGSAGSIERISDMPAMAESVLLNALSAAMSG